MAVLGASHNPIMSPDAVNRPPDPGPTSTLGLPL